MDLLDSFSHDTLIYFLRIAVIILAYLVLRPLIEATFQRVMTPREPMYQSRTKETRQKSLADELLVESDIEELEENHDIHDHRNSTSKAEWGGTMRKRQKARFMEAWEQEQARLAEEEELRELEDILED
jgi:hypothetical protein